MTDESNFSCALFSWQGWTMIGAVSALIAAIATVIYTYLTYRLLSATKKSIDIANDNKDKSNKIAEFQIYSKLIDILTSSEALKLFDIIARNCFEIDEITEIAPVVSSSSAKDSILAKDLRRFVLGPIEDMAKFKDDKILSMGSIDSGFGNTILMLGNNEQIIKYIKYLRIKVYYSNDIFSGFEQLYKEELKLCSEETRSKYKNHFD